MLPERKHAARSAYFFRNTIRLMSGQNSEKALLPIFPVMPQMQRTAASSGWLSLSTRHVFERKLLPTLPA